MKKAITNGMLTATLLATMATGLNAQTYCTSRGMSTAHGYINKVSMETINNTSGNNGGYADFTAQSATLLKGATYTIELTPGFISEAYMKEYWTVYIDYNHNGIFEPAEIVGEISGYIRQNKSFHVPATALNGPTRMRIQMQQGSQETNPCAIFAYGEVEDYTVVLTSSLERLAGENAVRNIAEEKPADLKLYPNPATDALVFEFTSNGNTNVNVNIYDLSGRKVMHAMNPSVSGTNTFRLNTGSLADGFYIFEMDDNGQLQHQKFLISR